MASEVCTPVIDGLVECALDRLKREAGYVLNYESFITTLKGERKNLSGPLSDFKRSVKDEERKGKDVKGTRKTLLANMEDKEEEADKLITLHDSAVQTCCWNLFGYCNCKYRRSMAKKAESLAEDIRKLIEKSEKYDTGMSIEPDPLALGPSLALGYKPVPSREQNLKTLTDALLEDKKIVIGVYGPEGSGKTMLVERLAQVMESEKRFDHIVVTTAKGLPRSTDDISCHIQKQIAERIGFALHFETVRERQLVVLDKLGRLGKAVLIITDHIDEHFDFSGIGIPWPACKDDSKCRIVMVSRSFEGSGMRLMRTQLEFELEVIPFSNDELREWNLDQKKPSVATKLDKLRTLNHNMERLERMASDIRDEVQQQVLQNRKRIREEVKLWLERVEGIRKEVQNVSGVDDDSALEGMTKQVDELIEQCNFPRGLVLDDFKPEGYEIPTGELEGSTPLEVQQKVWSAFRNGESRVGILGMGGVGKTSVAMHLNNEILAGRDDFKHVYYVIVSRDSSVHKLQGDISRALQFHLQVEDHETRRAAELRKSLKDRKKSLLILDDVWENIHLEKVGVALEGDGCKLLITTRKRGVCRRMNCNTIVEMRPLSEKEAWDLFVCKLGNYEELSDEAKRIARSICEECSGLPLAIITMAGCMREEFDEHVGRDMLRQLRNPCSNHDEIMDVFSILKLSYDRLKNNKFRECLLHCALYPEDYEIQWDDLIKDFIAAGLLDGSTRKQNTDMGHSYLNHLESASLLECVTGFGGMRCVKMHDLIRDMALIIIGRTGMVKPGKGLKEIPRKDEWTKDLVRVSLMDNAIRDIGDDMCPECPNLSVLILRDNPLYNISDSFFAHMAGLTSLDLSGTRIVKLPNSVANLHNLGALLLNGCSVLEVIPSLAGLTKLRYLDLHETAIKKLPEGVEKLINLEHLDLSETGIEELPEGVAELINLEHLDLSETGIQNIPGGLLCKLCKLETFLSNSKISILPKELTSLRQLSRFAGWVADFDAFKQFICSDCFSQLRKYFFLVGGPGDFDISFKSSDRLITIYDCQLSMRREVCFEVPHNVQILKLIGCSFGVECLLESLPSLFAATELESCTLASCKGLKYIISDAWFERGGYETSNLVELCLRDLPELTSIWGNEVFFPKLASLSVSECPKLKKLGLLNHNMPPLREISITECREMEEIFEGGDGAGDDAIQLPNLVELCLMDLPELTSIWGNGVFFPKLASLSVSECPKLKKLGLLNHNMPSLSHISITNCREMEEIFERVDGAGDDAIQLPNLVELCLRDLPELTSIWGNGVFFPKLASLSVSECPKLKKLGLLNHNMPSLREISITECREMEEIFEGGDGAGDDAIQLPNLVELCLMDLPELTSIWGNGVFFPKLASLSVSECAKLKKLGLLNHNMPSLGYISITNCREMEEMFERGDGAGDDAIQLPNLLNLCLMDLPELTSIWGIGVFLTSLFPKLALLSVSECPKLKKLGLLNDNMPSLREFSITECREMEEIFERGDGAGDDAIQLPNLVELCLRDLPELTSIWGNGVFFHKLASLSVSKCPKLKKLELLNHNMPYLSHISITNCREMEEIFERGDGAGDDAIQLPNLVELCLRDLPELTSIWGNGVFFSKLASLSVSECPKLKKLGLLNHNMPSLSHISITECREMEEIFEGGDGAGDDAIQLPNLVELCLRDLPELTSIWGNGVFFPKLDLLTVFECPKLKKLGLLNHNMPSLSHISITNCREMEEMFERGDGAGDDAIQLPNLLHLYLKDLPELTSIWGNGVFLTSLFPKLDSLSVSECPKLKKLGLLNDNMQSLREFSITECREMEEIFERGDGVGDDAIQLPNLVELCLRDLPELTSIWGNEVFFHKLASLSVSECPKLKKLGLLNHNMPSLREISITECREMEEIFEGGDGAGDDAIQLPNLVELCLRDLPELTSIWGNEVFFPKLASLSVSECPKLKKLGLLNHNMPPLREISITECREMEEIFEGGDGAGDDAIQLPNLVVLCLMDLPELTSIWGNGVFFPKLAWLSVSECPKLKKLGLLNHNMPSLSQISITKCREMEECEWSRR